MKIIDIKIYADLLNNVSPRMEIVKYIYRRLFGKFQKFDREVTYYFKKKDFLGIDCGYLIENCKVASRYFEPNVVTILDNYKSGTFIDCGCHIGKYSLFASKNGMNVIAIDRNKDNFLNKDENIKFIDVILDSYEGSKKFYINDFHPATSSVEMINNSREIELPCNKLDNICKDIKDIKLIKVDIENNELNAFMGATEILKEQHPDLLFECWDDKKYEDIKNFLESIGYNNFKLVDEFTYFSSKHNDNLHRKTS